MDALGRARFRNSNSTNFPYSSVHSMSVSILDEGVLLHMEIKRSIKPFVAPEEAACNLINCVQWCQSGVALWLMLVKAAHCTALLHSWIQLYKVNTKEPDITFSLTCNLLTSLPTMQHSHWVTSLEAKTRSDYMQRWKDFSYFFQKCNSTPQYLLTDFNM